MTIREVVLYLLRSCGDTDDPCNIKMVRRDKDNCVTDVAVVPISYIDSYDNICIEETAIKWEKFS